jgi:endogenous inhibitor of DNA gyrase (YacG/DUF329 family)
MPTGDAAQFTPDEEREVREAFRASGSAECPRCGTRMTRREIGGGSFGLGYARRREWLLCPTCRRSVIFDSRRDTRT